MFTKINLNNIIMSIIPMSYFVWSADFKIYNNKIREIAFKPRTMWF